MRVISGSARGRPLRAAPVAGLRPTSDRVKEAMFDVLAHLDALEGAVVLDAFAGSGALGIEALSRGAASVTFVEAERAAIAAIGANLAATGLAGAPGVTVVRAEVLGWLAAHERRFDLALVDPPYAFDEWATLLERLDAGLVVLESSRPVELTDRYVLHRAYRHGTTLFTVARARALEGLGGGAAEGAS